jgi:hypothetical protein
MYVYQSSFRQKAVDVHFPLQQDVTKFILNCVLKFERIPSPRPTGW